MLLTPSFLSISPTMFRAEIRAEGVIGEAPSTSNKIKNFQLYIHRALDRGRKGLLTHQKIWNTPLFKSMHTFTLIRNWVYTS